MRGHCVKSKHKLFLCSCVQSKLTFRSSFSLDRGAGQAPKLTFHLQRASTLVPQGGGVGAWKGANLSCNIQSAIKSVGLGPLATLPSNSHLRERKRPIPTLDKPMLLYVYNYSPLTLTLTNASGVQGLGGDFFCFCICFPQYHR